MRIIANARRIAGWTAALTVLLATLAPLWTHALSMLIGSDSEWVEVCTVQGSKWIAASANAGSGAPDDGTKHCPLCLFHASLAWLPPAGVEFLLAAADPLDAAGKVARSPARVAWPGSRTRAPPLTT